MGGGLGSAAGVVPVFPNAPVDGAPNLFEVPNPFGAGLVLLALCGLIKMVPALVDALVAPSLPGLRVPVTLICAVASASMGFSRKTL